MSSLFRNISNRRSELSHGWRRIWDADEGFSFFENPLIRLILGTSLFLSLAAFSLVYFFMIRGDSETAVLHYNAYFGIDIVGTPTQGLFIPGMALSLLLVNVILARRFYDRRERIASHILLFSGLFAVLSGAVAVLALSLINS